MSSDQSSDRRVGRGFHSTVVSAMLDACDSFMNHNAVPLWRKTMLSLEAAIKLLDPTVSDTATEAEIGHLIEIYEKYLCTSVLHMDALTKLIKQYPQMSGFDGMLDDMLEAGLLVRIHMNNKVAYAVSDLGAGVCKLHLGK